MRSATSIPLNRSSAAKYPLVQAGEAVQQASPGARDLAEPCRQRSHRPGALRQAGSHEGMRPRPYCVPDERWPPVSPEHRRRRRPAGPRPPPAAVRLAAACGGQHELAEEGPDAAEPHGRGGVLRGPGADARPRLVRAPCPVAGRCEGITRKPRSIMPPWAAAAAAGLFAVFRGRACMHGHACKGRRCAALQAAAAGRRRRASGCAPARRAARRTAWRCTGEPGGRHLEVQRW